MLKTFGPGHPPLLYIKLCAQSLLKRSRDFLSIAATLTLFLVLLFCHCCFAGVQGSCLPFLFMLKNMMTRRFI